MFLLSNVLHPLAKNDPQFLYKKLSKDFGTLCVIMFLSFLVIAVSYLVFKPVIQ